jgi:hypothetical protein
MYWHRLAGSVRDEWQTEIDHRLESGTAPVFVAGAPNALLPLATTLLAYQTLAGQRRDITTPLIIAGGSGPGWLALLLPSQPPRTESHSPEPTLLYGGADAATYLATLALVAPLAEPAAPRLGLTADLAAQFAPRLQPGAPPAWEALPLIEVGETTGAALDTPQGTADPAGDWIAYGAMVLAFCLVLSALLI